MKKILLLIFCILIVGCAHRVALSPNIRPNAMIANKLPSTVAVVVSDELLNYVEHARPSSWSGSAHTYNFEMGKSLCDALTRSVETAYENVMVAKTNPQAGEFDRIIKFALQNSNMDVYFQDGFLTSTGRANYSISIVMEAYNGKDIRMLKRSVVNGSGFSSRQSDPFSADKHFAQAIEAGLQQVSDNVANLLISGFAEEGKTASEQGLKSPEFQKEKELREINYADGSKYIGDVLDGKRHGQGTYIWPDGKKYVGEWRNNKAAGGWFYKTSGQKVWVYQDAEEKWIIKEQ